MVINNIHFKTTIRYQVILNNNKVKLLSLIFQNILFGFVTTLNCSFYKLPWFRLAPKEKTTRISSLVVYLLPSTPLYTYASGGFFFIISLLFPLLPAKISIYTHHFFCSSVSVSLSSLQFLPISN